ncbi:hypothetical protein Tco_0622436 [Tanacetum coccineum]
MAALKYRDEHNKFWSTASLRASEEGPPAILATIDRTPYTITESLVRSQLQLDDDGGVEDLPIAEIYLGMDNLGYPTEGKLTFHKNKFSPQWRFLVHTISHCLSTKSGSWDQFGSQLAIALICLTEGRREHMPLLAKCFPPVKLQLQVKSLGEVPPSNIRDYTETISNLILHVHESSPPNNTDTSSDPDETMGGSFHTSPPRSTQAPPAGTTSDGAEALDKLTALSSLVSTLVQKVNTQESELKAHKLLFKEVVGKLVKRVKLLEDKLKADIPPSSSIPTDEFAGGSDVPAGATTGPSTVSPSSTTVPTPSSVPAAETIPAGSGTTPESPSSPVRDARKGKGVAVDEPTPTQDKTFKQLEEKE